jgi:hypothetical protein
MILLGLDLKSTQITKDHSINQQNAEVLAHIWDALSTFLEIVSSCLY